MTSRQRKCRVKTAARRRRKETGEVGGDRGFAGNRDLRRRQPEVAVPLPRRRITRRWSNLRRAEKRTYPRGKQNVDIDYPLNTKSFLYLLDFLKPLGRSVDWRKSRYGLGLEISHLLFFFVIGKLALFISAPVSRTSNFLGNESF